MRCTSLTFDGLGLQGFSRAGDQTWFRVDPPGLALDVGKGAAPLIGTRWIFLSHSHLDHTAGIAWVLTQRRHQGLEPPTIFCPPNMRADLLTYIEAGSRLEGESWEVRVDALDAGESREIGSGFRLEAFDTQHSVPAIGCHLFRKRRKLKPELEGSRPDEVAELKKKGVEVTYDLEDLWMSYCGDSGARLFSTEPRIFDAEHLIMECTFMGPETSELGERYGHLHLNDLAAVADRFRNRAVVLSHLSRRHRLADFEQAARRELPALADRLHFIGGGEVEAAW